MSGPFRPAADDAITFTFDGRRLKGRAGDTLAAALLANGIGLVGRSFKYHRPRGIMTAGVEEPGALVTVGEGGRAEPNTRATDVFLYEGLVATSQNRWPSLRVDMAAAFGIMSRFIPAGFYYKTFFGSPKRWLAYEYFIRRAAGLGAPPTLADPDRFSQRAAFCDVLIVGGGPAGVAAARGQAAAGHSVMLVEQDALLSGGDAVALATAGVRVLMRTTASGLWDHGFVTLSQRLAEPGQVPPNGVAQRLWHVRAGRVILATGVIERPLAFAHNDRPGVMLSRAARTYVERFGVLPGRRVIVATNNDDGYKTADVLHAVGVTVVALLDARSDGAQPLRDYPVYRDAVPLSTKGARHHLKSVTASVSGTAQTWAADLIAVSGGFTPVVHLQMQAGGSLDWNEGAQAFVAGASHQGVRVIGEAAAPEPIAARASAADPRKTFVDFQNDVTIADLDLAWAEGYRSVEHLKRYTTLGMATDQGKLGNMAALSHLAARGGVPVPQAGLTTFRPPYTPLTMGAMAGASVGAAAAPVRRLPLHKAHEPYAPVWQPMGYWFRPRAYPQAGETLAQAALREAQTVRSRVGMTDVSTLAKFEISGPDAVAFLEIICATTVGKLAVGRGRYTFMLREDGMVFDDGTVWRMDETRYFLTSSTGGADAMAAHMSYVRNVLCPHLRVSVVTVQEHYAAFAVAGSGASALVRAVAGGEAPRHMSHGSVHIAGVPLDLLAASYSGERAFEIHVDAAQAAAVWDGLVAAVTGAGGCLYGIDAMDLLRIEKGHLVVGTEIDGRLTPHHLGLDKMLNKSGGFIGAQGLTRPALASADRRQLVGLEAVDGVIAEGAMLITARSREPDGHVTAAGLRVTEGGSIALGHLAGGFARMGEELIASSPTRRTSARVRVVAPHFYDAAGERYRD